MYMAHAETIPAASQQMVMSQPRTPFRGKISATAREVEGSVRLWLDGWALRSPDQDTHSWAAKMETMRRLQHSRP